jgi:hypothetical protein
MSSPALRRDEDDRDHRLPDEAIVRALVLPTFVG